MTVILGTSSAATAGAVFNRACGTGYIIQCIEERVSADLPIEFRPWHFGGTRRHYHSQSLVLPCHSQSGADGFMERDADDGRVIFMSTNATSSWAQVASGASDGAIDARAAEMAQFFQDHPTAKVVWSPVDHEPNNPSNFAGNGGDESSAAANWRAACERIWTRSVAGGMPVAQISQLGVVTVPGVVLCGPILIGGTRSGAGQGADTGTWSSSPNDTNHIIGTYNLWYPQSWDWGWAHMQAAGFDGYNQGIQRPFEEVYGAMTVAHGAQSPPRPGFPVWHAARRASQNALGRTFLAVVWETGTRYETDGHSFPTNTYWHSLGLPELGSGHAAAAWMTNMADYAASVPPGTIYAINWFDSAVGGQGGAGRMWDMTVATYTDGMLPMIQNPIWGFVEPDPPPPPPPPPPPGGFTPGVVAPMTRVRTGS